MRQRLRIDEVSLTLPDGPLDFSSTGRKRLGSYLADFAAIHQGLVARLLQDGGNAALLAEAFEDIGNRYLDLSELISEMRMAELAGKRTGKRWD